MPEIMSGAKVDETIQETIQTAKEACQKLQGLMNLLKDEANSGDDFRIVMVAGSNGYCCFDLYQESENRYRCIATEHITDLFPGKWIRGGTYGGMYNKR